LRLKAAETDRSISELIDEAVRLSLQEDLEDLAALKERAREPNIRFEDAGRKSKRQGKRGMSNCGVGDHQPNKT
jgi:hypothetical protein